jgi:serine/threonine-protein kinase
MAYLPGGSLGRRIASTPAGLPLEDVVCILSQVASALDYAHSRGVVHRDIKPGNILLDSRKNSYLSDFGVAQLNGIQNGPALGTFAYMAPEIASGGPASPASDIYALGVVLFEMLTGQRPFEAHTREAVLAAHAEPGTPSIRQHRPDLPPGLQVVVSQALLADPAARPPYASSLASALLRASGLKGLPCIDTDLDERSPLLAPAHPDDADWDYDPGTPVPEEMPERMAFEGPITPPPHWMPERMVFEGPITPPPYSMQPLDLDSDSPLADTAVALHTGPEMPEAPPPPSSGGKSAPHWVWILVLMGLGACLLILAGAAFALLADRSLF